MSVQKQPGVVVLWLPHVVTVEHVFLDSWELFQHRSDVCHFCDPLHQPHLSQRNRDLETTPRHGATTLPRSGNQPQLGNRGWAECGMQLPGWGMAGLGAVGEKDELTESFPI